MFSVFNTIQGTYLDAAEQYEERPFGRVTNQTLRANRDRDETLVRELTLPSAWPISTSSKPCSGSPRPCT